MSAPRLQRVLHRILQTPATTGEGVVSSIVRPGEIRLSGLDARVLVAGSSVPQVGERIAYVDCPSRGVKIASHNLPQAPGYLPRGPLYQWEFALACETMYSLRRFMAVTRDHVGRYWVSYLLSVYYAAEKDDFTTWTLRSPVQQPAWMSIAGWHGYDSAYYGGAFHEVTWFGAAVYMRRIAIQEDGSLVSDDGAQLPWPWQFFLEHLDHMSMCQDASGQWHVYGCWVVGNWDSYDPVMVHPVHWYEWAWVGDYPSFSSAGLFEDHDDCESYARDYWRPRLFPCGTGVIALSTKVAEEGNRVRYRLYQGGSWGSAQESPFPGTFLNAAGNFEKALVIYETPEGRVQAREFRLERGWGDPVEITVGAGVHHAGVAFLNNELSPYGAWVSTWDEERQQLTITYSDLRGGDEDYTETFEADVEEAPWRPNQPEPFGIATANASDDGQYQGFVAFRICDESFAVDLRVARVSG